VIDAFETPGATISDGDQHLASPAASFISPRENSRFAEAADHFIGVPRRHADILPEIVLPEANLPVAAAARRLRISRQTLHRFLAEKIGVTPAMALRLSRLFGSTPDFWIRMQLAHDLWHARNALAAEIQAIEPLERAA
jgi:addiction module HigA family antidote